MTLDLKNEPGISFAIDDYVIGLLLNLSTEMEYVKITHPEKGELLINPRRGEYIRHISDVAGFFQSPKSSFSVVEVKDKFPPSINLGRMEDLLWEATLHASQGRLVEGLYKYDVVQFTRWPNLTRVPLTPNVMRVCALFTRFPTGTYLAHAVLQAEPAEIYSICSAAKVIGIVKQVNKNAKPDADEEKKINEAAQSTESKSGNFLGRLFTKLSGL